MDRWYLPAPNQQNAAARMAALAANTYGPLSPWLGAGSLPTVVLANGQHAYTVLPDDGTLTKAAVDTAAAPFLAAEQAAAAVAANETTIRDNAQQALTRLRQIRDAPQISTANLAAVQALQAAVQDEARALIGLVRALLGTFDGTT